MHQNHSPRNRYRKKLLKNKSKRWKSLMFNPRYLSLRKNTLLLSFGKLIRWELLRWWYQKRLMSQLQVLRKSSQPTLMHLIRSLRVLVLRKRSYQRAYNQEKLILNRRNRKSRSPSKSNQSKRLLKTKSLFRRNQSKRWSKAKSLFRRPKKVSSLKSRPRNQ